MVDDASSDDSVDVAERLADEDGRVRVLRSPTNRGYAERSTSRFPRRTATTLR